MIKSYFTSFILLSLLLTIANCSKDEKEEVIDPSRAPTGTFTDPRDGQVYNTIDIGAQVWFAENLNYETPNSHWYDNDSANGDIYGSLYNLDEALNACPTGWHLPSDDEWKIMEMELGMSQHEANLEGVRGEGVGRKLKSTSGWEENGNGTNSSGFNGLPGGSSITDEDGLFFINDFRWGMWRTSTEYSSKDNYSRWLIFNRDRVIRNKPIWANSNQSIRCIKD